MALWAKKLCTPEFNPAMGDKTGLKKRILQKRNLWPVTAILLLFALISLINLKKPGIQYDEILFGNAALGGIDYTFITKKIGNVPIMLMSYIGALKAYIYYPIFKIFPVSAYTIRLPVIIIGLLTLFFTYNYLRLLFNRRIALTTVLLLTFDPSFIFQNKLDWGPVSISLFLKSLALFFLIKGMGSRQKRYFFLFFLCLGLGLFNKLDFIWFINALALSASILFYKELFSFFRKKRELSIILIISLVAFFSLFIRELSRMSLRTYGTGFFTFNLIERLKYQIGNFSSTLSGQGAYKYITNADLPFKSLFLPVWIAVILTSILLIFLWKAKIFDKRIGFFAILLLAIFFQIYATAQAIGTYHMMSIYPFPHIIMAFFIDKMIGGSENRHSRRFLIPTAYSAIGLVLISYSCVSYQYLRAFEQDRTSMMWSEGIYDLIEYVKENNNQTYVSLDWGMHNQLLAFTKGRVPLKEMVWTFNDPGWKGDTSKENQLIDEYICRPDHVFLFHEDNVSHYPEAKKNFFDLLSKNNLRPILIAKLGRGEKKYYELYKVDCASLGILEKPASAAIPVFRETFLHSIESLPASLDLQSSHSAHYQGMVAGDFDGDRIEEVAFDLGGLGIWIFDPNAAQPWNRISSDDPQWMIAAGLSNPATDELIVKRSNHHLWWWRLSSGYPGAWTEICRSGADYAYNAGDIGDGDPGHEFVAGFTRIGVYIFDYTGTGAYGGFDAHCVHASNFDQAGIRINLDGGSDFELIHSFPEGTCVWVYSAGYPAAWTQISPNRPSMGGSIALPGESGVDRFVGDYGNLGLWKYKHGSPGKWERLSYHLLSRIWPVGYDSAVRSGKALCLFKEIDGLWRYDGDRDPVWERAAWKSPDFVLGADIATSATGGNSGQEAVGDFGELGVWVQYSEDGPWLRISFDNPEGMIPADIDDDPEEEIICDFGRLGVWSWDQATTTWTRLSLNSPEFDNP